MRQIILMPISGVGDDDIAITNCALCGSMTSGLPICDICWHSPGENSQRAIDRLMLKMPKTWPGRKLYLPRIAQARAFTRRS